MSATTITYNGVTVQSARIESLEATPMLDQSGLIVRGIRFSVAFGGLVRGPGFSDFTDGIQSIQEKFSEPRKRLVIQFGGETRFDINNPANADSKDIDNGPIPSETRITKVFGSRAAFVSGSLSWTVLVDSVTSGDGTPSLLAHRFRQEFDIDEQNRVTRTVVGQAQFNGAIANVNPDSLRFLVWPVEAAGFRRVSASYAVSDSGLTMAYQVRDVQGFRPYPRGVLVASGNHSVVKQGSLTRHTLTATLKAEKGQPIATLIDAAHDIIATRIGIDSKKIESLEMSSPLFDSNELTFSIIKIDSSSSNSPVDYVDWGLFQEPATTPGTLGAAGRFRQITPYGSAGVRAVFQALFDPATEARPAAGEDVRRAAVESQTETRLDLDGDSFAESYNDGSDADELAAGVTVPGELTTLPTSATLSDSASLVSGAQRESTFYTDSVCSVSEYVETSSMVLPTADPTEADIVIQTRSPRVFRRYSGRVSRINASPVVPTPGELDDLALKPFILRSSDVRPTKAEVSADESRVEYSAEYEYVLESVFTPQGDYGNKTISLENGSSGPLTEWTGQRTVVFETPPTLAFPFGSSIASVSAPIGTGGGLV